MLLLVLAREARVLLPGGAGGLGWLPRKRRREPQVLPRLELAVCVETSMSLGDSVLCAEAPAADAWWCWWRAELPLGPTPAAAGWEPESVLPGTVRCRLLRLPTEPVGGGNARAVGWLLPKAAAAAVAAAVVGV